MNYCVGESLDLLFLFLEIGSPSVDQECVIHLPQPHEVYYQMWHRLALKMSVHGWPWDRLISTYVIAPGATQRAQETGKCCGSGKGLLSHRFRELAVNFQLPPIHCLRWILGKAQPLGKTRSHSTGDTAGWSLCCGVTSEENGGHVTQGRKE